MKMNKLHPKAKTLWYIYAGIGVLCLLAVLLPGAILIPAGVGRTLFLLCGGLPILLLIALILVLPHYRYQLYSFGFDEKRITVNHGVIFRHSVTIPVCQIQDLHRTQGPIMMMFKLSGVTISTAGSNFDISTLTTNEADRLIDELERNLEARIEELKNEEI